YLNNRACTDAGRPSWPRRTGWERWQSLVDCSCLESSRSCKRPGGSNPSRSATKPQVKAGIAEPGAPVFPSQQWRLSDEWPAEEGGPSGELPRHPVSVTGIVFRDDGRVLAIQRSDDGRWVPPGGVPMTAPTCCNNFSAASLRLRSEEPVLSLFLADAPI